jgi:hypothetical protein
MCTSQGTVVDDLNLTERLKKSAIGERIFRSRLIGYR